MNIGIHLFTFLLLAFAILSPFANSSNFINKYTKGSFQVRLNRNVKDMSEGNLFKIRYQLLDSFHTDKKEGPILVGICGQWLEKCMGQMQDLLEDMAPRLNAAILFVEHRFYGDSFQGYQPNNPDTSVYNKVDKLTHLRVEEVLDDIREVVNGMDLGPSPMQRAVLIGEDYAGALGIWMNMQALKDPKKEKPKFVWAASPSPLALAPDAPLSPKFDSKMTEILKQFGCSLNLVQPIFQYIDKTVKPGNQSSLDAVKNTLSYDGNEDLADMKANVLEVLRLTVAGKNVPHVDEKAKKYIWPLEVLCEGLKNTKDDMGKAHAFGTFMNAHHGSGLSKLKYQKVIEADMNDNELHAMNFQRCTEMPNDNCAAGGKNDAFFAQCVGKDYLKTKCKQKWLSTLVGYNPDAVNSLYQPDFIKTKFGFDFSKLTNMMITGNQFDQFAGAMKFPPSDPKRNFFVFPSIGLSVRGRELSVPNTCDPMSLAEMRTQLVDILLCLFHPHSTACVQQKKWPAALSPENRAEDAKKHLHECKPLHWQFPWASYPHPMPGPAPKPHNGAFPMNGQSLTAKLLFTYILPIGTIFVTFILYR